MPECNGNGDGKVPYMIPLIGLHQPAINHNAVEPVTGVLPHSSQIANLCQVSTLGNRLLPKFLSSVRNGWWPASFLSNCRYTHQPDVASNGAGTVLNVPKPPNEDAIVNFGLGSIGLTA